MGRGARRSGADNGGPWTQGWSHGHSAVTRWPSPSSPRPCTGASSRSPTASCATGTWPRTPCSGRSSTSGASSPRSATRRASMAGATASSSTPATRRRGRISARIATFPARPSRRSRTARWVVNDRDELERGFRRLSLDHRAVVVLHYYLDLTIEDTAEALGISVGHRQVPPQPGHGEASPRARRRSRSGPAGPPERGMNREPFDHAPLVEAWLKEPIWLPESDTARIAQLVHQTPQQRRWWPSLSRKGIGTMFSATKFVAAGVVVAAFVGFLFASGTFSPQPIPPVPGRDRGADRGSARERAAIDRGLAAAGRHDPGRHRGLGRQRCCPRPRRSRPWPPASRSGPDTLVAVGRRACERTKSEEIGRCWGQPWVSTDGVAWEAVEARTSGLDLGRFSAVTSGPEVGVEGVAYGPGGFVAYGWAHGEGGRRLPAPALWRSDDGRSWERVPASGGLRRRGARLIRAHRSRPSPAPTTATSWAAPSTGSRPRGRPSGRAPTG